VRIRKGFSYSGDRRKVYDDIGRDARNETSDLITVPQVGVASGRGYRKALQHEALQMHADKSGTADDQRFAHIVNERRIGLYGVYAALWLRA